MYLLFRSFTILKAQLLTFTRLDPFSLHHIIGYLDFQSLQAFSQTSRRLRYHSQHVLASMRRPTSAFPLITGAATPATNSVSFASTTVSTPGSHAEQDHTHSDTESSTPEEEDWEFVMTPDIHRRLSLIPARNHDATLERLPVELQLMIFKELDKIDSCCLGLAHPNLYVVFRAIHKTKMPLTTRRVGPNLLESAWEVVGKQECKQCGVYRCELYSHIKSWMPLNLEYCSLKRNFGSLGRPGGPTACFRAKPSKPGRCGRHLTRTTTIHQDDAHFNLLMPSST